MGVTTEHISKECATSRKDHFVSLDVLNITSKSHIKEVLILPELPERPTNVTLKVIPAEAELVRAHCAQQLYILMLLRSCFET